MVDTHHADSMLQVAHGIFDGGFTLFYQESVIERNLHDTTMLGKGAHLVVGKVAGMVAEGTTTAMTAYDRCLA